MKKKRLLSMAMALCLVLGSAAALPKNAFVDSTNITASAANTATSGKCGKNVSWSLDGKGVLTISGSGKMTDYYSEGDSPFYDRKDIKSVVIKSDVTSIGFNAFHYCENLTSITIPGSVTSIGDGAFWGCEKLTSVTIHNGVTSIGEDAFSICSSLASITIPSSVTSIGKRAFKGTKWLEDQQKKNPLVVVNGILIDGTKCSGNVNIPNTVTSIGEGAFWGCEKLTSITIPNSVTSIGVSAFCDCSRLTSITIPSSVTSIGYYAFEYCENLTSITIPNSVTSITGYVFYNCTSLTSVTIPNSVTSIGDGAFRWCSSLKSITIPNSVTSIGNSAFDGCSRHTSKTIPSSVTSIGGWAFSGCTGLKSIIIPKTVTSIKTKSLGYLNADSDKKVDGFVIIGEKGTAAETYAKNNQMNFVEYSRLAGAGRYTTAAEISKKAFPSKADTVILAYSMNYADALAGVPLAVKENAPILLTNTKSLDSTALAEIKRLKASKVIILGGEGVIGKQVETELVQSGIKTANIKRIAGKNRFSTAATIAQQLNTKPTDVFFVYGNNFADALSVSTVAASKNAPIVYLTTNGSLHPDTAAYLAALKKAGSVKNAYVIGGEGVISDDMMNKAANALGLAKATRVAGKDRFKTCVAVNETFAGVLKGDMLCVATGMDYPDALAGGVYAAKNKAPLFLINGKAPTLNLNDEQKAYLKTKGASSITAFGGVG
ncbi:MAG: leucine-rich repeat protein, partial [Ruminococcus sp.]|nr:leucine-rich repeat protein [Ruminococcus sp.]